jgi:hypothetical protein
VGILSIKNGNDNVPIEDNCLEEELATTPKLSEIGTLSLSLTFVMLMRFFARLNIYYKTLTSKLGTGCNDTFVICNSIFFIFLNQIKAQRDQKNHSLG